MTKDDAAAAAAATSAAANNNSSNNNNANGSSDTILSRKLKKLLSSELDSDADLSLALRELSSFFPENTLTTRRFLRGEIERRSLKINQNFLEEFTQVKESVDGVHSLVHSMRSQCTAMQRELAQTKAKTRDLIRQTSQLQAEGQSLATHEQMVQDFIARYQLTEEEMDVIKGVGGRGDKGGVVTQEFFNVLDRVQKIHADCKGLLQSGQQTTALEIMEQMSLLQESALERLYRWTQAQCRSLESAPPDTSLLVSRAMRYLRQRPVMFKYVLDEYCASRRATLVRAFIDALTVGGPGGTPRPIELHAHEPPRYVGDMLAWLHQAIPTETENLRTLLKSCSSSSDDMTSECERCVGLITEDVCRPLRSRVEQILLLEAGAVVLYKLTNLIRFYAGTMRQVLPREGSALLEALDDLDQLAYKQFLGVLQTTVAQQAAKAEAPGHDLAPTQSTLALLGLLRETLSGSSVVDEHHSQLEEIVSTIVDPLLSSLTSLASAFPSTDQDVFMLNSLYQIHLTLALFQFNDARLKALQNDMQLHLDTLSSEQTSNLIANLGLQPICTMVAENRSELPLSKVPGMEQAVLRQFLGKFDGFLVAPDVFLLPQARLLVSSAHRKQITRRSLEVVAASYGQLYQAVMEPGNQYENAGQLMPKTPEQVALLLQL